MQQDCFRAGSASLSKILFATLSWVERADNGGGRRTTTSCCPRQTKICWPGGPRVLRVATQHTAVGQMFQGHERLDGDAAYGQLGTITSQTACYTGIASLQRVSAHANSARPGDVVAEERIKATSSPPSLACGERLQRSQRRRPVASPTHSAWTMSKTTSLLLVVTAECSRRASCSAARCEGSTGCRCQLGHSRFWAGRAC